MTTRHARRRFNPSADDGLTLVEVLVTIAIMTIMFAAVLAGLATMISASALHRRQANVGAVVRSATEAVKATAYVKCDTAGFPSQYTAALPASPDGSVSNPTLVAVTKIGDRSQSLVGCAASSDPGLQLVQLQATSTDGRTTETLWVVKALH